MYMLEASHLKKIYETGSGKVYALDDVSFSVETGEFVAILGPSGCGKSTLLHILGGVDEPTEGEVCLDGNEYTKLLEKEKDALRRQKIGMIYQAYNLVPVLNVEENIVLPVLLDGRNVDQEKLNSLLKLLDLEEERTHLPNQLSGGQQQRTAIARAVYQDPNIIPADEPTGNLDQKNTEEIVKLFQKMNRQFGLTIIMVTHDEAIARQCDRTLYMKDGKIV
ncbi:ABC transporter ATP-binding protein [Tyzzerella nexilis]|nr:ABC transporter ATP-binding protein [[Clostridium] nexile]MCB7556086.1 ABC transporter ATP-binding protein [[Clostridium] nexile]MCC3674409.1 ABC transporter ATP-binding protein [[Clostridium] nexile]NSD84453.1 ABC transporter ATP-binding protein [[Clostridium] nexile]NSD86907.1 ABC transporter ATP-binding protein [[Clostridium] nexile]